ncbi:hypothetical protein [Nonomuraea soli]|uniref:Uncharacterized protein n=1 Tax=Nonomuraea soli TaxID=1032476 RepID=A0A7W0CU32_9ACTN|nr:hypothetical protein [Nonomuraea soli]MBA2897388.1 hypothetical protein [Nonomuraea soli]
MTQHDLSTCPGPPTCGECAQQACTEAFQEVAGRPPVGEIQCPRCGQRFGLGERVQESAPVSEAMIDGERSFDDVRQLVRKAIADRLQGQLGLSYVWVYISDLTGAAVVYAANDDDLYQCDYAIDAAGVVTLGTPVKVVRTYAPDPAAPSEAAGSGTSPDVVETRVQVAAGARVIEAKGTDADGGRIFRTRIIAYGDSKNGRRYPESVLRAAAPLYEGAKAFDHHRTEAELASGTIVGLVGHFRAVEAEADGLYADLHLLPSCTHAAEALDASLGAQADDLDPVVGLSHDVMALFKPISEGGRRLQEATAITRVYSADLVADPAAGGKASRVLAGGIDPGADTDLPDHTKEETVPPTLKDILGALKDATPEELAAAGLAKAAPAKETDKPEEPAVKAVEVQETPQTKGSFLAGLMVRQLVTDAGLPESVVEAVTTALPERFTEADVATQIAAMKAGLALVERAGLTPTVSVQVTKETHDKKIAALDAMFDGNYREGYRSFRQAYADFTGRHPKAWDEDYNRQILRESIGGFYDSAARSSESMNSATWDQVLGDSITRRMIRMYSQPSLQTWRQIVSEITPVSDFRQQRRERIGGYGLLPVVGEGAPYQPLQSPTDEEATFAVIKRGGTEDLTMEMIANDDLQQVRQIPRLLGLAAAITLYRFVWDVLQTNPATTYDATALFHVNHGNTDSAALSQSALTVARRKMRKQAAYGNAVNILSTVPKFLVVPSELEELAWQHSVSPNAIPGAANDPADRPNLHRGLEPIVIDYWTDANDWFEVADPNMCPTIEVGFYQGREDPELFTQADPNVGSMYNADKVTYKIRHIYDLVVLDHRGFYRGTQ